MNARYLLDTNILSEAIKPQPSQAVTIRLTQHKAHLATASVVVGFIASVSQRCSTH